MSEELLIRHCAPTLAGLKTGNMFSCTCDDMEALRDNVRKLNRTLVKKGLRMVLLRNTDARALLYVFRPAHLKRDLQHRTARKLLCERGYSCETPEQCVAHLIRRLRLSSEFPHEIGLFLGYPPEDIYGFIEHRDCKCCGYWKVYDDEAFAQKQFAKFDKCAKVYQHKWIDGLTLERLTVAQRAS